jgi:hypothetical protein
LQRRRQGVQGRDRCLQGLPALPQVEERRGIGGRTQAYVCDRPPAQVKAARAVSVRVAKQGKITLLVCGYGDGLNFTWRSRAECKVEAGADCAANPAACKASCE